MDIIEVHRKDTDTFEVGKIIFNNKKTSYCSRI